MSRLAPILLCLFVAFSLTEALSGARGNVRSFNSSSRKVAPTTRTVAQTQISSGDQTKLDTEKSKSRSGLSAWGIVALIISFILLCMGTYYTVLFYPVLCAKERKYDIIDLSPV